MPRSITGLSPEAGEILKEQSWNGNIRELQNCVEKAVILSEGTTLTAQDIDFSTPLRSGRNDISSVIPSEVEESQVREAMERCNGNISAAAKMLGISRPTLYAKLKKYGL